MNYKEVRKRVCHSKIGAAFAVAMFPVSAQAPQSVPVIDSVTCQFGAAKAAIENETPGSRFRALAASQTSNSKQSTLLFL